MSAQGSGGLAANASVAVMHQEVKGSIGTEVSNSATKEMLQLTVKLSNTSVKFKLDSFQ